MSVAIDGLGVRTLGAALVVYVEVAGREVEVVRTYADCPVVIDHHVTALGLRGALAVPPVVMAEYGGSDPT